MEQDIHRVAIMSQFRDEGPFSNSGFETGDAKSAVAPESHCVTAICQAFRPLFEYCAVYSLFMMVSTTSQNVIVIFSLLADMVLIQIFIPRRVQCGTEVIM